MKYFKKKGFCFGKSEAYKIAEGVGSGLVLQEQPLKYRETDPPKELLRLPRRREMNRGLTNTGAQLGQGVRKLSLPLQLPLSTPENSLSGRCWGEALSLNSPAQSSKKMVSTSHSPSKSCTDAFNWQNLISIQSSRTSQKCTSRYREETRKGWEYLQVAKQSNVTVILG